MTINFPWQKSYERVELFLRRHWLILAFIYLRFVILLIGGILFFFLINKLFVLNVPEAIFSLFLLFVYLLIIWQILFISLTDYYLDTWIVTDHRILDIHQIGLFKRDVAELRVPKIQDINVEVKGLLATFFDYGDVIVQTAGTMPEFNLRQIPHPYKVKDKILEIYDQYNIKHIGDEESHEKEIDYNK